MHKNFFITEYTGIYVREQTVKIDQRILKRRCGQQDLGNALGQIIQAFGPLRSMKYIPKIMRLINYQKIPFYRREAFHQLGRIVIGRNDYARRFWIFDPRFCPVVVLFHRQTIKDCSFQIELFIQFDLPLFPECGGECD